jgi:hypothetical protein
VKQPVSAGERGASKQDFIGGDENKKLLRFFEYTGNIYNFFRTTVRVSDSAKKQQGGDMVSLTDSAVGKFKEVVAQQGADGDGVRIFVVPGG